MRSLLALAISAAASAVLAAPIGEEGARHLLGRAGFGASPAEVAAYAPLERAAAVDKLLDGVRQDASTPTPAFLAQGFERYQSPVQLPEEERKAAQQKLVREGLELREWWLREMLDTPSPLTERMTLFWHNHFATSQRKVRVSWLMYQQNVLLRRESLGNFGRMLHAVAKDPAMLVYLDNARSRREAPNENFAREVMELFTLGEGRYAEADIKEAARAFTGWSLDPATGEYRYRPNIHDGGAKTVLGKTGRFSGEDVLDILLARPETAEFVTTKLWREMVSPTPDRLEVQRIATVFRDARYEVKPLVRAMLLCDAFWSAGNRAALIKSPVDLVVGTMRTYDMHPAQLRASVVAAAGLGQNLFAPPNVKGWPGGDAWIDSATLLGRKQYLERLMRGGDNLMVARKAEGMAEADAIRVAVAKPEYQLK
jgi:uncharacterized protein (DUF1800 family)